MCPSNGRRNGFQLYQIRCKPRPHTSEARPRLSCGGEGTDARGPIRLRLCFPRWFPELFASGSNGRRACRETHPGTRGDCWLFRPREEREQWMREEARAREELVSRGKVESRK